MSVETVLKQADSWRTQYNPLRGLTIARAVSLLEAGQRGEFADLQWTYEFVEETDPDLLALVERRTSALSEMDWNIKIVGDDVPGFTQDLADAQAAALREAYDKIENLYEAIEHLEMAAFKGFAIAQPHDANGRASGLGGDIARIECLDQWNFARAGRYGAWYWNPNAQSTLASSLGEANRLDENDFLIRVARRPIDRIGLIKFVRASMSEKDWDAFIEIYGLPAAFVIGPEDVPESKETEFRDAAEDAAEGGGGYLPHGSAVEFASPPQGTQPFETRLEWLSKKLVLAGTGGMLTMLTESGSGTLAGGAHSETFRAIARAEAARVSEIFQKRLDRAILDARFAGRPRLAYFELSSREERNVTDIVGHIGALSIAGYQVDPAEASEKTGYTLSLKPAPAVGDISNFRSQISNSARVALNAARGDAAATSAALGDSVEARLQNAARDALARATAEDLAPLRKRIEAALAIEDDQAMLNALRGIIPDLPDMLGAICRDPAAALALEQSITAALVNGVAEGVAARSGRPAAGEEGAS